MPKILGTSLILMLFQKYLQITLYTKLCYLEVRNLDYYLKLHVISSYPSPFFPSLSFPLPSFLPPPSLGYLFSIYSIRGSSRGRSYSAEQKQGPWPHRVKRPAVRKGVKYTNTIKRISVLSGRHEQFNLSGGYCNSWFSETTATKWSLAECLEGTQSRVCIFSSCFGP